MIKFLCLRKSTHKFTATHHKKILLGVWDHFFDTTRFPYMSFQCKYIVPVLTSVFLVGNSNEMAICMLRNEQCLFSTYEILEIEGPGKLNIGQRQNLQKTVKIFKEVPKIIMPYISPQRKWGGGGRRGPIYSP